MNHADLLALDDLLGSAGAVVPMRDIHAGADAPCVIGLRHDVDDNKDSLETAVQIARWEQDRGYRSTFFVLHSAGYWRSPWFPLALAEFAECGHEVGIHVNAVAEALRSGGDPADILHDALAYLRGLGHDVIGVAPHGDQLCHSAGFVNDEMFSECARPEVGEPARTLEHEGRRVTLAPMPLADFGLAYETYRLPKGRYLSDSGGAWNVPLDAIPGEGQLHILWHPDWWADAFTEARVAA